MKTQTDFLQNYSSNPDLAKETLKAGGLSWNEIKKMGKDAYNAGSESVPGMIYYKDTVSFAKRNYLLILQALDDFENECGKLKNRPSPLEEEQYYNWLAWFAWKNTINEVLIYLDEN